MFEFCQGYKKQRLAINEIIIYKKSVIFQL